MNIRIPPVVSALLLSLGGMPAEASQPAPIPASATAPAPVQDGGNIEFMENSHIAKVLSLDYLEAIAPPLSLEIFEPHEGRKRAYRVLPVRPVFDTVFGNKWKEAKDIVFLSGDGYRAAVPVAKFVEYEAYLAFAHDDGGPFTMINTLQNNELVQLGPLYLVWDNMNSEALRESGASDMPYQIKAVELKSGASFPK